MANRKTNKSASKTKTEVKEVPAVEAEEIAADAVPVPTVPEKPADPVPEKPVRRSAASRSKTEKAAKTSKTDKASKTEEKAAKTSEKTEGKDAKKAEEKVTKRSAGKKTSSDKPVKLFMEFGGDKYDSDDIVEKCKAHYKADNSRKQVRSIEVYVNVQEKKAYYVVNGKSDGLFIEL